MHLGSSLIWGNSNKMLLFALMVFKQMISNLFAKLETRCAETQHEGHPPNKFHYSLIMNISKYIIFILQ